MRLAPSAPVVLLHSAHSRHPWRSAPVVLLHPLHSNHPWWSVSTRGTMAACNAAIRGTPRTNGSARGPAVLYSRQIVYVLGAVWLTLFGASFVVLQLTDAAGDGLTRSLNRLASFMTWQISAFVVAIAAALVARCGRGARGRANQARGLCAARGERVPRRVARGDRRVSRVRRAVFHLSVNAAPRARSRRSPSSRAACSSCSACAPRDSTRHASCTTC